MSEQKAIPILVLTAIVSLVVSCTQTTDSGITGIIKSKLAVDDRVRASEINVDTANGVVTLTGNVDSQESRDRVMKLAKDTSGVREVKDMISVREGSAAGDAPEPHRTLGERIDDTGITMRVKSRLRNDSAVKDLKIDVDTRDGVVYLTGSVPGDTERKRVIELASTTEGVKNVEANLL